MQNDIKRVIAYSTCSQLGYMFVGLGVGGYSLGMFHLFTHAFFKALLFLGAGSVITAMHHEQDMRRMGGLRTEIPFTFWMMVIGSLALTGVGIPFTAIGFAGYVSKDPIIEAAFASQRFGAGYAFLCVDDRGRLHRLLFVAAPVHDLLRQTRRLGRISCRPKRTTTTAHGATAHDDHGRRRRPAHELPLVMLIPLAVLALGATFAGVAFRHWFIGGGLRGLLAQCPVHRLREPHPRGDGARPLRSSRCRPTLMMLAGLLIAYYMYIVNREAPSALADTFPPLYRFLLNKWYFDELYDAIFVRPAFAIGRLFWKGGDGAIIDGFGPDGVSARVLDVTRGAVQTPVRLHLPIRLRDAARRGRVRDLVSVRGEPLMSGSWILSGLLLLPLIGAAVHPAAAGRDGGDEAQRALDRALRDGDHLRAESRRLGTVQSRRARFPARRGARLVLARHSLQARRRRHIDALRAADDLPHADLHRGLLDLDPEPGEGVYGLPSSCSRR